MQTRSKILRFSVIMLCLFYHTLLYSQQTASDNNTRSQEITFDSLGRLVEFPAVLATSRTAFTLRVAAPVAAFSAPWLNFLHTLTDVKATMEKSSIASAYKCLLGNDYTQYVNGLGLIISKLKDVPACSADSARKALIDLSANSALAPFPLKLFQQNIDSQYKVLVFRGSTCVDTVRLGPAWHRCEEGTCHFFIADYMPGDPTCPNCLAANTDQLQFVLVHSDPLNETIRQWYTLQVTGFNDRNKAELAAIKSSLEDFIDLPDASAGSNLDKLDKLKPWFKNWFWFTGGELSVNPFWKANKTYLDRIKQIVEPLDAELKKQTDLLTFLDSARKYVPFIINSLDTVRKIQAAQDAIQLIITNLNNQKKEAQKSFGNAGRVDTLNRLVAQNNVSLFLSKRNPLDKLLQPMQHVNAADGYKLVPLKKYDKERAFEIAENERPHIMVHNIPDTLASGFNEKALPFDDLEQFTATAMVMFNGLGTVTNVTETGFNQIKDYTPGDLKYGGLSTAAVDCILLKQMLVKVYGDFKNDGDFWPANEGLFAKQVLTTPTYRTDVFTPQPADAPYKDSIVIKKVYKKDSTVMRNTFIKVGKLRWFQVAAGIAVNINPANINSIDTSGGGFRVSSANNRSRPLIGFKLYPFQQYNRDNSPVPRYPFKRISFFGGFDLLKPLDNFYAGLAYDIVPGLAVSGGENFYLATRNKVENNAIIATTKGYKAGGIYCSVMVNPVLLAQLFKTFIK